MNQRSEFTLDFAAATDIGCVRGNNEDSFGYDAEQHVYVVCDGMGGSAAGEVASGMAVRAMIERFEALDALEKDGSLNIEQRLLIAIHAANQAVREAADANPHLYNMGTTLVCACLSGTRLLVGNVGDSRAYLIRNGVCSQITLDHSLLDEQVRQGLITREMAAQSNLQSVITRAIGATDSVEPDLFAAELSIGDMFLLTSDGLTRYASPEEITTLVQPDAELTAICHALIEHAKQRGGADNVTCMMLRVVEPPAAMVSAEDAEAQAETLASPVIYTQADTALAEPARIALSEVPSASDTI
ncbi:MAG TPA: Stp1/IreP family PP2C-type Ser/Thr phosphatase [Acidobacteriaceae bacterium]|nr:Stp1/IreP family PP2C-type Ser/Thr phosphatase [Acidobacteriaceae bacterium]